MITKYATSCCALAHLTMTSDTDIEEIKEALNLLKEEKRNQDYYGTDHDAGGQTAVFTITTPSEEQLALNLQACGFKKVNEFERRNGYPSTGILSMWVVNIPETRRIFGNRLIGIWFNNNFNITPTKLEEKQNEFKWKCSNPDYPNNLYPHTEDGTPLLYDEEV
jgi:hypothetical protein